jgi:hypothetical protein
MPTTQARIPVIVSCANFGLGVVALGILALQPRLTRSTAFVHLRDYPGGMALWGVLLVALGAVILVCLPAVATRRWVGAAMLPLVFVLFVWAVEFLRAAFDTHPPMGAFGAVFATITAVHAVTTAARMIQVYGR